MADTQKKHKLQSHTHSLDKREERGLANSQSICTVGNDTEGATHPTMTQGTTRQ